MPPRRGFSAGRLAEVGAESAKGAKESLKDEPGDLLTKLLELSCGHFFTRSPFLFPCSLSFVCHMGICRRSRYLGVVKDGVADLGVQAKWRSQVRYVWAVKIFSYEEEFETT